MTEALVTTELVYLAGILYDEEILSRIDSNPPPSWSLATLLNSLPSYKTILNLLPGYNL